MAAAPRAPAADGAAIVRTQPQPTADRTPQLGADRPPKTAEPQVATAREISEGAVRTAAHTTTTASTAPMTESNASPAPESPADQLIAQAHELSRSAQSEAEFTRIIETCRKARAMQPDSDAGRYASHLASWAFNRRGQLRAEAGRQSEALLDFEDAIRADGERWLAIHNRGLLLAQAGELERAFDDFARTIELKPDFAKAYSNRAALLMVAGDVEAALRDYQRAIELNPELAVAQRGCGRACHVVGRLDEAIRYYDQAVRLAPNDAYAAASRADLLTDLGRYADAAAEYERAIRLDPKSGQAHSSSAWLLATCPDAKVRNSQLAIDRAAKAVELTDEKDALAFDTQAAALASAGDFEAAMQSAEKAMAFAPPEEREVYHQRLLLYQHGKPYRIAPVGDVVQASYETAGAVREGGRWD